MWTQPDTRRTGLIALSRWLRARRPRSTGTEPPAAASKRSPRMPAHRRPAVEHDCAAGARLVKILDEPTPTTHPSQSSPSTRWRAPPHGHITTPRRYGSFDLRVNVARTRLAKSAGQHGRSRRRGPPLFRSGSRPDSRAPILCRDLVSIFESTPRKYADSGVVAPNRAAVSSLVIPRTGRTRHHSSARRTK